MVAHRCESCKVDWPPCVTRPSGRLMDARTLCPVCGGLCALMHGQKPLDESVAKHMVFDAFWAKWEAVRIERQSREISGLPEAA